MQEATKKGNNQSKIEEDTKLSISSADKNSIIFSNIENIKNNWEYKSIKYYIDQYDKENISIIKNSNLENIQSILSNNISITPIEYQNDYSNKIIDEIDKIQKSNEFVELPILPYGTKLSDLEFIILFKNCVKYANYKLNNDSLKDIKKNLLDRIDNIKNLFKCPQILKDLKENALLSILTSIESEDQTDNFNLLNVQYSSITPLIKMNFNNHELNKQELIETFCSCVYIKNYMKSLKKFIPNFEQKVPTEEKLKEYIKNYFISHDIYFCDIADKDNILAVTIHTANMYLKARYLEEYFQHKNGDNQIIIREKIILNIAHELNHTLVREINLEMKSNFFIKSNYKGKKIKDNKVNFISKFDDSRFHHLDIHESGNLFDFYFYNKYYFDDLYEQEANLFLNIKNIKSLSEYKTKLNDIIKEERLKKPKCYSVNKFKKLENGPARCIKSKILGVSKVKNSQKLKIDDEDVE